MRSFLNADHQDYGEVEDYYEKMGRVAEVERALWSALREGNVDRSELLEAIVEAAGAPR